MLPTITVVNINRREPYDIYCGRDYNHTVNPAVGAHGWLGNPFSSPDPARNILSFRSYFERRVKWDTEFALALADLATRALSTSTLRLGCFCAPSRCHADVIAAHLLLLCAERLSTSSSPGAPHAH